jgi:hypothetical protein
LILPNFGQISWIASKRTSPVANSLAGQWQQVCKDTLRSCGGKRVVYWGRGGDQHTECFPELLQRDRKLVLTLHPDSDDPTANLRLIKSYQLLQFLRNWSKARSEV